MPGGDAPAGSPDEVKTRMKVRLPERLLPLLLVVITGVAAYADSFGVPFQFDDYYNITEKPVIQRLDNFLFSRAGYDDNPRRYIGHLTLALNYRFGGEDVTGYHVVNLAIHIAASLALYLLVLLLFRTSTAFSAPSDPSCRIPFLRGPAEFIALLASLLFVSHPIQTQSVTYIVQRLTSLATFFYLCSVCAYVRGRLAMGATRGAPGPSESRAAARTEESEALSPDIQPSAAGLGHFVAPAWFALFLLCVLLAMKTKEISLTLPFAVILVEFSFFRSKLKTRALLILPVLLTLVIVPLSVIGAGRPLGEILSDLSDRARVQTDIPRLDYFLTQMRVIMTYLRLIIAPVGQNLDYDYPVYHSPFDLPVIASIGCLLSLALLAVCLLRRALKIEDVAIGAVPAASGALYLRVFCLRLIAFGIFWFFIALSVESSVIPIADLIFEHRMYLPSAGVFIAVSATVLLLCLRLGSKGSRFLLGLCLLVVVGLAGATFARNRVWNDEVSLWEDVTEKSPGNARAWNNLGYAYLMKGLLNEALTGFQKALSLRPAYADAITNLGVVYYRRGNFFQSAAEFKRALAVAGNKEALAAAHHNLGLASIRLGLGDDAMMQMELSLRYVPDDTTVLNDYGVALVNKGYLREALEIYLQLLKVKPNDGGANYNIGMIYARQGRPDLATPYLQRAHDLDPGRF